MRNERGNMLQRFEFSMFIPDSTLLMQCLIWDEHGKFQFLSLEWPPELVPYLSYFDYCLLQHHLLGITLIRDNTKNNYRFLPDGLFYMIINVISCHHNVESWTCYPCNVEYIHPNLPLYPTLLPLFNITNSSLRHARRRLNTIKPCLKCRSPRILLDITIGSLMQDL